MSLFDRKTCTPMKGTPWSTAWAHGSKILAMPLRAVSLFGFCRLLLPGAWPARSDCSDWRPPWQRHAFMTTATPLLGRFLPLSPSAFSLTQQFFYEQVFWNNSLATVTFPCPFLAGNCAEKYIYIYIYIYWVPIWRGGNEDFRRNGGEIAENSTSTDVNRRYFGVDGQFFYI